MQTNDSTNGELFRFSEEEVPVAVMSRLQRPWHILVIDDDPDVHQATRFALEGTELFGRPLALLHAHSAAEAQPVLLSHADLALVLLDVVMETPDAGLKLVAFIRDVAGHKATRIVLRTGQPGYAPELDTLLQHDINDYKTKSELTHHKLVTTVAAALRSYDQLCTIEASRKGLEMIVQASGSFLQLMGLNIFAQGVITQMAAILGIPPEGLVCAQGDRNGGGYRVLAAAGHFADLIEEPLEAINDRATVEMLQRCLREGVSQFGQHETALYLGSRDGLDMAAYICTDAPLSEVNCRLLDVFCANLSACLRNLSLVQRLETEAYVDPLLRLPNRTRLIEDVTALVQSGASGQSLVLVDVDDFASVNDLMGHAYGDLLLQAMSQRLREQLEQNVVLARVSGNSFGLLGCADALAPARVLAMFQEPLLVAQQPHRVSVTLGVCHLTGSTASGADWLKNASIALKLAKRSHRGRYEFFSAEMASHARNRAKLLSNLHAAFDQDRLYLAFQPQLDLNSGELIGLEALMRWRGDDGKMVPPDQFIPVAEQSGLIVSLGDWVLQTACVTMRQLLALGAAPQRMAVNVSVVQFQSPGFVERVLLALAVAGLTGAQLELEITESVAMLGAGVVEPILYALREQGISVAIDDFGTGYSSLSYLESLPLDRIKIDKTFVFGLAKDDGPRIAEMIVQLGHKLGLRVLAEGVETEEAWESLKRMGCHEAQGYYIARPMDSDELVAWLTRPRHTSLTG
jgi:diguanylate cyclase (GGDEF)-like protein